MMEQISIEERNYLYAKIRAHKYASKQLRSIIEDVEARGHSDIVNDLILHQYDKAYRKLGIKELKGK